MANRHMKKRSMSLAFWEMQIRTTMRSHDMLTRVNKLRLMSPIWQGWVGYSLECLYIAGGNAK